MTPGKPPLQNPQVTADIKISRYTGIPFPDRRYLPGIRMTRPVKDRTGHIPQIPPPAVAFDAATWNLSQRYLYAVDLFNYRYWWEAHEVLEELWLETGKRADIGKFVQGLIQISAALLKSSQPHSGSRRLAAKGLAKLRLQSGIFLGLDVHEFGRRVEAYIMKETPAPPAIELRMPDRISA
ncbi:MAG TPA: DUF309 domain-containing protein [Gammaproteobacteria bacterium]|nr:DUF309 domain-containing protein [Gammaproteobacteria bacterium]